MDRVWVIGAGGPAGFNVAAAAKAAGYRVVGVDNVPARLPFAEKVCDVVLSHGSIPNEPLAYDELVLPQPEALVALCASLRAESGYPRYHGPSTSILKTTTNKAAALEVWAHHGLRSSKPVRIGPEIPDWLHIARDTFGGTFWLRANNGAGARGAILVSDLREAYHWIRLHEVRFGMFNQFIAEEFLPGRDFCWTALYHEGYRIASFARERLEWIYPHLAPFSGRTGTPVRSRVVHDSRVLETGRMSVEAIDKKPHGVYCVDMREDKQGIPRPTEINAGRWATTSPLYRHMGPNLVALQIRLAHDDRADELGDDIYPEGAELMRHIDMGLVVKP